MYRTEHYLFAQRNVQDRKANFNLVTHGHTDGHTDTRTDTRTHGYLDFFSCFFAAKNKATKVDLLFSIWGFSVLAINKTKYYRPYASVKDFVLMRYIELYERL